MKERQYGLDILRIIAMLLITAIHYVAYSGILNSTELTGYNRVILSCVGALYVGAVNLFILITGYFSCEKKLNFKRLTTLWIHVVLLGVVLLIVGAFALKQPLRITIFLKTIFPLSTMHYWFFTMYMVLMLISPLLNILLNNLTEQQHKGLCIVGFFILSIFFVSNPFINAQYYIADARGIVWLSYLYIVGAGFRKYDWRFLKKRSFLTAFFIYGLLVVLQFFQVTKISNCQLLDGNGALAFSLSVLMFSFFRDIHIKGAFFKKVISEVSSCSFLVYILQEHDFIRNWYWDLFEINSYAASPFLVFNLLISLLALWPVSWVIQFLFNILQPGVDYIQRNIVLLLKKFVNKGQEN